MRLSRGGAFAAPLTVLQGDRDERVEAVEVAAWAGRLRGEVCYRRFEGASHFFHGRLTELKAAVTEALQRQLPVEELA